MPPVSTHAVRGTGSAESAPTARDARRPLPAPDVRLRGGRAGAGEAEEAALRSHALTEAAKDSNRRE